MRILICDDDTLIIEQLKKYIESYFESNHLKCPELVSFTSGEALLTDKGEKDIVFLDIEMPIMNGLECAREILQMDLPLKIVFATGYSQFALQAFDLEAFDYILKPYSENRIRRIIERLTDSLALQRGKIVPGEVRVTSQKVSIQTKNKTLMISPSEEIVLVCTEKSDRSLFYTTSGIVESRMTLRDIESLLTPLGFFRTHKGYIVNLSMIHEIQPQDNGTLLLTMTSYEKQKVPVSRHYIKAFKSILHI